MERKVRAYHLKSFLARHATRKLTAAALTCRRRSKNTSLKRSGETLKGPKRQGAHRLPAESEAPGAEINTIKIYKENSKL
ncbi:hypothetical protein QUF49_00350 [Fictibacillus sp. b24]|uniref:hypothetical protein n=1 Tax=Fictibacillus sp. b24 TaxID=3055863 RepID=UPI0025A21590|nr:hypothetical protein [Fictibacillus sp. b24]MDM5314428.1 hypothetical protein [Fictibacillus sp. b24]